MQQVSWSAVLASVLTALALAFALAQEATTAMVLGLCAITWAILSLKERS